MMSKLGNRFRRKLSCSFCGKSEHEVAKLIAGPSVLICDECVVLCVGILQDGGPVKPPSAVAQRHRFRDRIRAWFGVGVDRGTSHLVGVLK